MTKELVDISKWDRKSSINIQFSGSGTVSGTTDCPNRSRTNFIILTVNVEIFAGNKKVFGGRLAHKEAFSGGCFAKITNTINFSLNHTFFGMGLIPFINEKEITI